MQQAVSSIKQTGLSPGMQFGTRPEVQNCPLVHIAAPLELDDELDEVVRH